VLLPPAAAALLMSTSTMTVAINAELLRRHPLYGCLHLNHGRSRTHRHRRPLRLMRNLECPDEGGRNETRDLVDPDNDDSGDALAGLSVSAL
jgi:hypothetical protein